MIVSKKLKDDANSCSGVQSPVKTPAISLVCATKCVTIAL
jgi:hypothetical protein